MTGGRRRAAKSTSQRLLKCHTGESEDLPGLARARIFDPPSCRNVLSHMRGSIACVEAATLLLVTACGGGSGEASREPAASNDRGILFSSKRDGDFEIYVMDADGGNVRQLTRNEALGTNEADDGSPSWSPDGQRIAFTSTRDHEGDGFDSEELYVMGADGDGQTRLTENESGEGGPRWSPDGEWLLFPRRAVEKTDN